MVRESVKETFERCATEYDRMIEKVVPYYHEQHEVILSLVPFAKDDKLKILDLGIGTGVLGRILLQNFPNSMVHGIDISEKMIEVCKGALKDLEGRYTLSCGDIEKADLGADHNIIVAGLTIHHLTDEAKREFFGKIYSSLNNKGVFLIRDIIKSGSDRMNELYHRLWRDHARRNGFDPDKIDKNSKEQDIPTTLENHITWLKEAGFKDVDCVWKYYNFAIFAAYK